LVVVVCLVVGTAGVAGGLLLQRVNPPEGLAPAVEPSVAPVTQQSFDDTRPVTVTFRSNPDIPLVVRAVGTVTRLSDSSVLTSGKPVLWVDARPVVGLATSEPLYRDLEYGDSGTDVAALNAELKRLGYDVPSSDEFTTASRDAWRKLLTGVGVADPGWMFSVADTLWLPGQSVTISAWRVSRGAPVPGDGTVAVIPGAILGGDVALMDTSAPPAGPLVLTVLGVSLPVDGVGTVTDATFLAGVGATTQYQWAVPDADGQRQMPGTVRLATPITVLTVPPVAVFALVGRDGCVQSGDQAIPVTVVGSSLGTALIQTRDHSVPTEVAIGTGITKTSC